MPATIKVKGVDVGSDSSRLWVLRDVEARPKFFSTRLADSWHRNLLLGLCVALLSAASFASPAATQDDAPAQTAQIAKQADAWFENYKFRDGETITRLRIHYATLGELHRNAAYATCRRRAGTLVQVVRVARATQPAFLLED